MGIRTVGVVGLGIMGAGIVEVYARAGFPVTALEIDEAALERGRAALRRSTERAVSRGKLTEAEATALLDRITFSTDYSALSGVDLVVEAAPERMAIKREIFGALDRVCRPDAILATNTSSLSVTEIAHQTAHPGRVLGMHFFNPAPVMKLVEVIRTISTAPEHVATVEELAGRLGKVGVTIGDRAGFVANYLLLGYLNQAAWRLQDGYLGREDLDEAMRLGAGLPMGPLTLMDLIGIDTIYEIMEIIFEHGGRSRRHASAPLLRQMALAGKHGRKTGEGFYRYQRPGSGSLVPDGEAAPAAERRPGTVGLVGEDGAVAEALRQGGATVVTAGPDDLAALAGADLVLCRADSPEEARDVFRALGAAVGAEAVLALDSSTVPVIDCAMASGRPERVVGAHLVGELVEVVRTVRSGDDTVAAGRGLAGVLGRRAVVCPERPGLLVHGLLAPYLNDAVGMLAEGYADADGIDNAMTLGCGYPIGPIAHADRLGAATVLRLAEAAYRAEREPSLAPAPLLAQLATAGGSLRQA